MESMDHIAAESNPPTKKILFKKKKEIYFLPKKAGDSSRRERGMREKCNGTRTFKKKKTFEGGAKQMTNARLVPPFGSPLIHPRVFVLCDEQK